MIHGSNCLGNRKFRDTKYEKKHFGQKNSGSHRENFLGDFGNVSCFNLRSVIWVLKTWNNLSMEEIVYHLKMPLEGTNDDIIWDYIFYCAAAAVLAAVILTCLLILMRKKKRFYRVCWAQYLRLLC